MTGNGNRVSALLATPRQSDWYRIQNRRQIPNPHPTNEDDATVEAADVFVYGTIGGSWWDDSPTAAEFVRDLSALDVRQINLYVNSPGGSVYDGIAMRNALKRHPANVTATVDGLAASAASFLLTGGDEIVMGQNTELMIHDALTIGVGNAADFRQLAGELDSVSDNIASMYASKAGGDAADWRALMIAETWFSAEEAVTAGLADRVADVDGGSSAADAEDRFDLSIFAHKGRADAPAPANLSDIAAVRATFPDSAAFHERFAAVVASQRPERPAEPGSTTQNTDKEGAEQMPGLKKELANRLGLTQDEAELDEQTILDAIDEALNERAEEKASFTAPEGTVVVDKAKFDELTNQAAQGAEARAQQVKERRDGIVDAALRAGKITAASKDTWRDSLEKNEESTVAVLNTLAEGAVLNTRELGYTGGVSDSTDDDEQILNALGWGAVNSNTKEA